MTSEDRDVVVNLGPVALCNTFTDPDDVSALLLLQLEEGVEEIILNFGLIMIKCSGN